MAKEGPNYLLIGAGLFLGYILIWGMPDFGGAASTGDGDGVGGEPGMCIGTEDVSFTPRMTRLGKAGTTIRSATDNYYILTDNLGSQVASASTTVPVNYEMEVMFAENTSSYPSDSTPYYTIVETVTTTCGDPFYLPVQLPLADTSLNSFYCENSDGTVNAITNNESMGTADVFETTCYFKAGAETYFGNPTSDCKNIAVVEYDRTYISKIEGNDPEATPGHFAYNASGYDGASAFAIPKSADGEIQSFNVKVTADASTEPDGTNPPIVNIFDCDIGKDADTLELIEGVTTEDNAIMSLVNTSTILWID